MTKEEILKQIEELKKQVEDLPDDEKKIRTLPDEDEKYFYINDELEYESGNNYPNWFDVYQIKENSSVGNYFKSKEDAEMVIKAMQIEQAIRIRRIELNDGWEPDWDDINEYKYFIYTTANYDDGLTVGLTSYSIHYSIFGYYKSKEIAKQIIEEFGKELFWYFTEYYPNKDRMYVWGLKNDKNNIN